MKSIVKYIFSCFTLAFFLSNCSPERPSEKQITDDVKAHLSKDSNLVGYKLVGEYKPKISGSQTVRLYKSNGDSSHLTFRYYLTKHGWRLTKQFNVNYDAE